MLSRAGDDVTHDPAQFSGHVHLDHIVEVVDQFEKLPVLGVDLGMAEAVSIVPGQECHQVSNACRLL
jgi:hypothetical protein